VEPKFGRETVEPGALKREALKTEARRGKAEDESGKAGAGRSVNDAERIAPDAGRLTGTRRRAESARSW